MATMALDMNSKPKLSELQMHIRPFAAEKWEDIGTALGLADEDDGARLDEIATRRNNDNTKCFNDVMKLWLQTKAEHATWATLFDCMKQMPDLQDHVLLLEKEIFKQKSPCLEDSTECGPTALPNAASTPNPVPVGSTEQIPSPQSPTIRISDPEPSFQDLTINGYPAMTSTPQPVDQQLQDINTSEMEHEPSPAPFIDYSLKLESGMRIRNYQRELAEPGINGKNYIFIAPTGSGKTLVSALVISEHLKKFTKSEFEARQPKVIFVVDTKPLADQQKSQLAKFIPAAKVECCVGDSIVTIEGMLPHADIVVCTAGKLLEEIQKGKVRLSDITLMVIDECHHTKKNSPQARVMERYLKQKFDEEEQGNLPQVVGLTASPGAGDNKELERQKTIDHLLSLCALMDATSGLKVVQKYREELEQFTNKPTFTMSILNRRDENEEFIRAVVTEMKKIEQGYRLNCLFKKWSQEYETSVQQRKVPLELSTNEKFRDQISAMKLLLCYSQALNVYMDLRNSDTISVLEEFDGLPTDESQATDLEQAMKENIEALIIQLRLFSPVENPLLKAAEAKLHDTFQAKPESRGIVFVRTKKHASAMCDWIKTLPIASTLGLKPRVLTGHTRDTSAAPGMTQAQQEEIMESFRKNDCNLLVATSVAEEGLDVPACNLVIRFQHVSDEIGKVQTIGRARAEGSEGLTILSSDSKKRFQELKNDELIALVQSCLERNQFPSGEYLERDLEKIQKELLSDRKLKQKMRQQKRQADPREVSVHLRCKRCKTLACYGLDIYSIEDASHYVVPREDFRKEKIVMRPHHKPGKVTEQISKTHKIHCAKCDFDWGILCIWPSKLNYSFPVLKCKSFVFEVNGVACPGVAQWSNAPFEPYPFSHWLEVQEEEQEED